MGDSSRKAATVPCSSIARTCGVCTSESQVQLSHQFRHSWSRPLNRLPELRHKQQSLLHDPEEPLSTQTARPPPGPGHNRHRVVASSAYAFSAKASSVCSTTLFFRSTSSKTSCGDGTVASLPSKTTAISSRLCPRLKIKVVSQLVVTNGGLIKEKQGRIGGERWA